MLNHRNVVNVTVIPAQPGYRPIFCDGGGYFLDDCDVIAWRIETHINHEGEALHSRVTPLDASGDSACVAVLTPKGSVDELCSATYESYEAFLASKKRDTP